MNDLDFKVAIPARYNSSRLPGKPLLEIAGKPMIQHTYERAKESGAAEIAVATDDKRIFELCETFGAKVCMTNEKHQSGTDRLAELSELCGWVKDDIVVNLQGDEPFMSPDLLRQVAYNLASNSTASIATLYTSISDADEIVDPHAVKLVKDVNNFALYFSRAPIPWDRDKTVHNNEIEKYYFLHLGIYAYRVDFLLSYKDLTESYLERLESLEQLRALSNGYRIHVDEAVEVPGGGVDTVEDLARLRVIYG